MKALPLLVRFRRGSEQLSVLAQHKDGLRQSLPFEGLQILGDALGRALQALAVPLGSGADNRGGRAKLIVDKVIFIVLFDAK